MRLIDIFEKWSQSYKKSINCSNPKGFSQRAHCAGRKARQSGRKTKSSSVNESKQPDYTLINALRDFLPIAVKFLKLKELPKIHLAKELHDTHVPTFGRFTNQSKEITVVVNNRNPVDIIRTLAHELAHYAQGERGELDSESWHTGSDQENQAHEQAGIMMREFDKKFPKYLSAQAVNLNESISKNEARDLPWEHLPLEFDFKVYVAPYKNTVAVYGEDIAMVNFRQPWYFSFVADLDSMRYDVVRTSDDYETDRYDEMSEVVAEVLQEIASTWGTTWEEIDSELHGGFGVGELCESTGLDSKINQLYLLIDQAAQAIDQGMFGPAVDLVDTVDDQQQVLLANDFRDESLEIHNDLQSLVQELETLADGNAARIDQRSISDTLEYIASDIEDLVGRLAEEPEEEGGFGVGDLGEDRDQHCSSSKAVPALKSALSNRKTQLNRLGDKALYDKIDKIMRRIAQTYGITPEQLHDLWVKKYGEIPDTWILDESAHDRAWTDAVDRHTRLRAIAKRTNDEEKFNYHNREIQKLFGHSGIETPDSTFTDDPGGIRVDEIGVPPVGPVLPMPSQLPRRSPPWPSPEEQRKKKIKEAGEITPARQWIRKIYDEFYEHPFNPRHRVMTWGEGDDQELAIFELATVFGKPTTVDIKWFQAYPQRRGIGRRAMQKLQQLAQEDGITLTLYPWNKGEISQSKLTKIYKGMGFKPSAGWSKDMTWSPDQVKESLDQPYPITWISMLDGVYDAVATLPDGSSLRIIFNDLGNDSWEVDFMRDARHSITGQGDAQRVFATVMMAIQQFIKKQDPWMLTFSANKEGYADTGSRVKLYNRMVERYARAWRYEAYHEDHGDKVVYELTRIGEGLDENFADGKVKGKSRPGRVKRAGASCKGSVSDLRARAKKYGGERGKMYHWCANMKSGKNK